jgi:NAD+ synthase (glutamine-hydrolysing)
VVRIALGQLNTTVGDLDGNVARMAEWAGRASASGADLICFPELAVTGYPPEDLILRSEFRRDTLGALDHLAHETAALNCALLVGFVDDTPHGARNAAAVLQGGHVSSRYHKMKLPNYGVFDELRYFTQGSAGCIVRIGSSSVGVSICEDAWTAGAPFDMYAAAGIGVLANINASPYHARKTGERLEICSARARETDAWVVYVNAVGGQDELVFDGGSMVVSPGGDVAAHAAMFEEDLLVVTLEDGAVATDHRAPWPLGPGEVYGALVLGLRDYVRKNGFHEVVVGLSGGIDSAFVATLAVDALGADAVRALAMPSPYSSRGSVDDARECARRLGIRMDEVRIDTVFGAYRRSLADLFAGTEDDVAEENIQARIRGNLLMAVSNKFGSMVLATGNKSEYAVGYATLYGDMSGGFAPIKDVPKTQVYELARWRNRQGPAAGPIPAATVDKPPSAELRLDQVDADSLPAYEVLDPIMEAYVEDDLGVDDIVAGGADRELVERITGLIDRAEYKRRQAAPGVKITPKAFGRDRRLPITNRYGPG